MKRALLALACACALSACSAATHTPAQAIFAMEAAYDAALDIAVAYATQPRCAGAIVLCSDPAMVRKINDVAHQAWIAMRAAQAAARAVKPDMAALAAARAKAERALENLTILITQLKMS